MKTTRLHTLARKLFAGVLATMIVFSIVSCARKTTFLTSSVVPAAQGSVKVKTDNNNNYVVQVDVLHLAEPQRLQPPKLTYVVWMETDQNVIKNIGQISSSTSMFSKKLKATLETVSSFRPVKVYITAEDDPGIQYPGAQVVLSTDHF